VPSSAGPGTGSGSGTGSGFTGSFLGKQFSFAGGKGGVNVGDGGVISTQPTQRPSEEPPAIPTMASSAVRPESSVSISGTTNTDTERAGTGGYQPVTNYEQQERVNPFDKEPNKSGSAASIHTTTSSSVSRVGQRPPQTQSSVVEDAEDTMKNLRKTFAGIFGDM